MITILKNLDTFNHFNNLDPQNYLKPIDVTRRI